MPTKPNTVSRIGGYMIPIIFPVDLPPSFVSWIINIRTKISDYIRSIRHGN